MQVSNAKHLKKKYFQYHRFYGSMVFRIFMLIALLATYIVPSDILSTVIDDEIKEQIKITESLTNHWNTEVIIGPVLSIPYIERISRIESQTDSNGVRSSISRDTFNNKTLRLLPENLFIEAALKDKVITEGTHNANTYEGDVTLTGNFNLESLPEPSTYKTIEWDKAIVAIGFNDNKGVEVSTPLRWEGSSTNYKPGTGLTELLKNGMHVNIEDVANDNLTPEFKIQLTLKGTNSFQFAPLGKITIAKIISDSQNIDVSGEIPENAKNYDEEDFEADWEITSLKRNYPQEWLINENEEYTIPDLFQVLTGVELSQSNDEISNLNKVKTIVFYIIPFLAVLFLSLSVLEYIPNNEVKPKFINYLVISLPILLMPVLTLTLSYSLSFIEAYIIATIGILCTTMIYLLNSLRSVIHTTYISLVLISVYVFLYIVIDMNQYELLAATITGAFLIFLLMIASINLSEEL